MKCVGKNTLHFSEAFRFVPLVALRHTLVRFTHTVVTPFKIKPLRLVVILFRLQT